MRTNLAIVKAPLSPAWSDDSTQVKLTVARTPAARDRRYLTVLVGSLGYEMYRLRRQSTIIGRSRQAHIAVPDEGVSRHHAHITLSGSDVFIADIGSTNGTFLNGRTIAERTLLRSGDKIQLGPNVIMRFEVHDALEESFERQRREAALVDGLTGVFNRKHLLQTLDSELAFSQRHQTPLSLLLIDIDHFKTVNDSRGHCAGDEVLRQFARLVAKVLRKEDLVGRYGGEEFAVLCKGIDARGALVSAERLRRCIEARDFGAGADRVTVSIGVATLQTGMRRVAELIAQADQALYRAKACGRNCVRCNP